MALQSVLTTAIRSETARLSCVYRVMHAIRLHSRHDDISSGYYGSLAAPNWLRPSLKFDCHPWPPRLITDYYLEEYISWARPDGALMGPKSVSTMAFRGNVVKCVPS